MTGRDRHPEIPEGFEPPPDSGKVKLEVGEKMIGEIIEYKPDNVYNNEPAPLLEVIDQADGKPKTFWMKPATARKVSYCNPRIGDLLFIMRCPDSEPTKPGWSGAHNYEVAIQRRKDEATEFPPAD